MGEVKMTQAKTLVSAVTGTSLLLAGLGMTAPLVAPDQQAFAQEEAVASEVQTVATEKAVEGTFTYSQTETTANDAISSVFTKAAATLCQTLPTYCAACGGMIQVTGLGGSFDATVSDMAGDDEQASSIMACSCSSNVAGGGAVANAGVSGVGIAQVASLAGAA